MKKILSILGAVGLIATTGATVVACGETKPESQEKLQEKFDILFKKGSELQEKLHETSEGSEEYLKIKDELAKNNFEICFFVADVFLDTKYSVDLESDERKILEEKDEWTYHLLLKKSALNFKNLLGAWKTETPEWMEKYAEYLKRFQEYVTKLEKKAGIEVLSKLSVDQLNEKIAPFIKVMLDLVKENEGTDYPYPGDNPDLKEQWVKGYFNFYCFIARIFLETEYVVDVNNEKLEVKEVKDEEYQKLLKMVVDQIADKTYLEGNKHYIYIFDWYIEELIRKL